MKVAEGLEPNVDEPNGAAEVGAAADAAGKVVVEVPKVGAAAVVVAPNPCP